MLAAFTIVSLCLLTTPSHSAKGCPACKVTLDHTPGGRWDSGTLSHAETSEWVCAYARDTDGKDVSSCQHGSGNRGYSHYEFDEELDDNYPVYVATYGGDGLWIDDIRMVWRKNSHKTWGDEDWYGWCLSTDHSDANGGWSSNVSKCRAIIRLCRWGEATYIDYQSSSYTFSTIHGARTSECPAKPQSNSKGRRRSEHATCASGCGPALEIAHEHIDWIMSMVREGVESNEMMHQIMEKVENTCIERFIANSNQDTEESEEYWQCIGYTELMKRSDPDLAIFGWIQAYLNGDNVNPHDGCGQAILDVTKLAIENKLPGVSFDLASEKLKIENVSREDELMKSVKTFSNVVLGAGMLYAAAHASEVLINMCLDYNVYV